MTNPHADQLSSRAADRTSAVIARIDAVPVSAIQIRAFLLCLVLSFTDGFDVAVLGLAVPLMAAEWGVPAGTLGPALSASIAGVGVGALVFGPLGDRLGRKPLMLASCVMIAAGCFGTAIAAPDTIVAWRLLAGIGFGSSLPNMYAMTSDVMPARRRVMSVTLMALGAALGSILAGIVAPVIASWGGWESIFVIGGAVPIVLTAAMALWLPESPFLLARRERDAQRLAALLRAMRIDPDGLPAPGGATRETAADRFAILKPGYLAITLMLMVVWISTGFIYYSVSSWIPSLLVAAGWNTTDAMHGLTLVYTGGLCGGFALSWLMDRSRSPALVAAGCAACAAVLFLLVGTQLNGPLIHPLLVLLGVFATGGLHVMPGLVSGFYPPTVLGTALGAISAISRLGSVAGPLAGGYLMLHGWSGSQIIAALAGPQLLSMAGLLVLFRIAPPRGPATAA